MNDTLPQTHCLVKPIDNYCFTSPDSLFRLERNRK